jgi:hypothetical protein
MLERPHGKFCHWVPQWHPMKNSFPCISPRLYQRELQMIVYITEDLTTLIHPGCLTGLVGAPTPAGPAAFRD